ncbi:MAG TPA: cytochrome C oxidase subunit IV family protein [Candidatus Paceibacterota bacterium]|nr:cytochrome C oxidase subunit IV family protein [Candidatus Paceibacterota bacterium]
MNPPAPSRPDGTVASYVAGFVGSLLCTLAAYAVVAGHLAVGAVAIAAVVAFAVIQLGMQLFLFLHLGKRGNAMNRVTFALALIIVFIVVAGALWIMTTLNGRMVPSESQMLEYMQNQTGL